MASPLGLRLLSELRDDLEAMLSINSGDSYIDSSNELNDINEGYKKTAYKYDWPTLLYRRGIVKVANLDRYSLPSDFRKARTIKLDNTTLRSVELEFLKRTNFGFFIDQQQNDIILYNIPSAASTAYTLSNAESAGNAVTIELDTVSGLSQHDEIWIDSVSGTDEFTMVSSVSSSATTITARLDAAKSASDILYRQDDIIDLHYYRRITLLSAAGDTTLLPDEADQAMLHYAAHKAYLRLELFDEAEQQYKIWERDLREAWLAADRETTGEAAHFSIG